MNSYTFKYNYSSVQTRRQDPSWYLTCSRDLAPGHCHCCCRRARAASGCVSVRNALIFRICPSGQFCRGGPFCRGARSCPGAAFCRGVPSCQGGPAYVGPLSLSCARARSLWLTWKWSFSCLPTKKQLSLENILLKLSICIHERLDSMLSFENYLSMKRT